MKPYQVIWTDLRALVTDTARVWWRLLPQLLALQMGGWLGYQMTLWGAAIMSTRNGWVAIGIFSLGFVFTLSAIVLMLRLVGRELGVRRLLPRPAGEAEAQDEERENSVSRLLALTLLPFLGIYASFNYVSTRANDLSVRSMLVTGGIFGSGDLLEQVNPNRSTRALITVISVVVGAYLVRRLLDLLHERAGWPWLGVALPAFEAFFLLTVILAGVKVLGSLKHWLLDRQLFSWLDVLWSHLAAFLAIFKINLPAVAHLVGHFLVHDAWPALFTALAEPVAWLAVAALVYGSHVLSLAELWRKGQPLAAEVPIPRRLRGLRQRKVGSTGLRRATLEFQEAFFGDIDDKYLPTFQSIRLILRSGLTFLGAYILVYTGVRCLQKVIDRIGDVLSGGRLIDYWVSFGPFFELTGQLITEPLRISLLAVAFHRCLQVFKSRASDVDSAELPDDVVARTADDLGYSAALVPARQGVRVG